MWQPEHQKAFQELKQVIAEAPVLAYYDPNKENVIQSDASMKGLDDKGYKMGGLFTTQAGHSMMLRRDIVILNANSY